jgi:Peptidase inhibitor I9.
MLSVGVAAATVAALTLSVSAAQGTDGGGDGLATYQKHDNAVAGSYLVRLQDGADAAAVAKDLGVKPRYVYDAVFDGFAAKMNSEQLEEAREYNTVESVAQNYRMQLDEPSTEAVSSWGAGPDRPGGAAAGRRVQPHRDR